MRFSIVAGEPSGDMLGAGLIAAIKERAPQSEFIGVGGPRMIAAGLHSTVPMERLTMNGFVEPVRRLPELLRLLLQLRRDALRAQVSAFIGVDFNFFNLLLERRLKVAGVPTVHYVSPSVYAWRRGRVKRVARATDLMLTLFPFEPPLYEGYGVKAICVGHPLAMEFAGLAQNADVPKIRHSLGVSGAPVVAVMPGSRMSEIRYLLPLFLKAMVLIRQQVPRIHFIIPCINQRVVDHVQAQIREHATGGGIHLVLGRSAEAMLAADVVLTKSGTSTLEALLLQRPMVVAYRLGNFTYQIVKRLLRTPHVALPNILAGRSLVPELLQDAAHPRALADAVLTQLRGDNVSLLQEFQRIGDSLRLGGSARAADAVLSLVQHS